MGEPPPPSYREYVDSQRPFVLSFVDFIPRVVEVRTFGSTVYEPFGVIFKHANEWLQRNPHIKVKTVESIEIKEPRSGGGLDSTKSCMWEAGVMTYVRCLRLWIVPKLQDEPPEPIQLGYVTVTPICLDSGGFFSKPQFESFGITLQKLNQRLQQNPIPGKVIAFETQDMRYKEYGSGLDPERSAWRESTNTPVQYVNVLRVFYEIGTPLYEQIGCVDFAPERTESGGFFSSGNFEPFHVISARARQWIHANSVHVTNVQSIDYKLSQGWSGERLDTHRSFYYELGKGVTFYVRIIRVCYTSSSHPNFIQVNMPTVLSYRTFSPLMLQSGGGFMQSAPVFETQIVTMKKAMAWLQHTNARIISAETVTVRLFSGHQYGNAEVTYTHNPGNRPERHMFVLRLYLDGDYNDPPPPAGQAAEAQANMQSQNYNRYDDECCNIL